MPTISDYNTGLKLQWVKRLATNCGPWRHYLTARAPFNGNVDMFLLFLGANQNWQDCEQWFNPNENNIFTEVLKKWCHYNFKPQNVLRSRGEILKECIWFNSCIKINNQTVFKRLWYNLGICSIENLLIGNRWLTMNEMHRLSNNRINHLDYLGVLTAVPQEWRRLIKQPQLNEEQQGAKSTLASLIAMDKPGSAIRKNLARHRCIIPETRLNGWNEELNTNIELETWLTNIC